MGRSIPFHGEPDLLSGRGKGIPMPIVPTENKGIMSGPIRKSRRQERRMRPRGSRPDIQLGKVVQPDGSTLITYGSSPRRKERTGAIGRRMPPRKLSDPDYKFREPDFMSGPRQPRPGQRPLRRGEKEFMDRLTRDREAGITRTPEEESKLRQQMIRDRRGPRRGPRRGVTGRRMPPRGLDPRAINIRSPLSGGYNPESGVRYTDTGVPTAVEQTTRVPVKDPTLGGPPEREVPIPRERLRRITRESDPRGAAPFSPDERGMARDRFFERMFDRADERKQQKAMERAERDNVGDALRSERELRESELAGAGDERQGRRDEGRRGRVRRGKVFSGGMRRRRRGRRRDFTRRRSQMEGGRRGRSGREMAEFRDQYVSTLR